MRVLSVCLVLASSALAAAPEVKAGSKWTPPAFQVRQLASGAKLWVHSQRGIPLVHVGVHVAAGSVNDPADKPGLAMLTATCVEEGGAGARTGAEVRAFFDSLGTELKVGAMPDGVTGGFTVLTSRLEPALGQLVEVLSKPRFEPDVVAAVKTRRRSEILSALDDPRFVASVKLSAEVYGANPRNHPALGTVAGVEGATLDDLKKFHAANWSSAGTTFILVGDVEPDAAKALLDKVAPKAWLQPAKAAALTAPAGAAGKWLAFDKPGAAQTVVLFGRPGPSSRDDAVQPLELVSTVLGGSFTSRLVQNLREKHGYTYGVGARLGVGRETKLVTVQTSVKTEVTVPALVELLAELEGIKTVSAGELEKARSLLDARLVEDFSSGESVLGAMGSLLMEDLGPDALAKEKARREKVTLDEVKAASARFEPGGFTVVLVGDRAKLEKDLKAKFPERNIEWRQ